MICILQLTKITFISDKYRILLLNNHDHIAQKDSAYMESPTATVVSLFSGKYLVKVHITAATLNGPKTD